MEKFTSSSEYDRDQAKYHARVIAFGIATGMFALAGLIVMISYGYYSWLVFGGSVLCAMVSWGFTYAIVYVVALPTEPTDWSDVPEREIPEQPPANNDQAVKHQFAAVFDERILIAGKLTPIPQGVYEEDLYRIHSARLRGELDTVSENKLNSIGVSRWADDRMRAKRLIDFLVGVRAIDEAGNWMPAGEKTFPSPTTNIPHHTNGGVVQSSTPPPQVHTGVTPPAVRGV